MLFKNNFEFENYLNVIKDFNLRKILTKFRLSDHNLEIELGRRRSPKVPVNLRFCRRCDFNLIDDETHLIFDCPIVTVQRKELFEECCQVLDNSHRKEVFLQIMKNHLSLAKFLKKL